MNPDNQRMIRAKKFASQIMRIVGIYIKDKNSAYNALTEAAYKDDSIITKHREENHRA